MIVFEGNIPVAAYAMEWRPCARFPDYEVSEFGDIRRRTANYNRPIHGTSLTGVKNGRAKLTDEQAFECRYEYRKLRKKGLGYNYGGFKLLKEKYGIGGTTLRLLGDGHTWTHLPIDERPL
jgi:hypothetical protein